MLLVLVLCTLAVSLPETARGQANKGPAGELRWGLHVTLAARWLDPAETEAFSTPFMVMYALHDAMVKPMPDGFFPFPPYDSMGKAIVGYLQAVGIKSRMRTMERAAYFTAWREKKPHGAIHVITAAFGNAATRLEPYATKNGVYAYGALPEIDDLYVRQARELDVKKREAMVHQI
jgi:hypothetical protein